MTGTRILKEKPDRAANGKDGQQAAAGSSDAAFWRERHRQTRVRLARLWTAYQTLQLENAELGRALAERVDTATTTKVIPTKVTYADEPLQEATQDRKRSTAAKRKPAKRTARKPKTANKTARSPKAPSPAVKRAAKHPAKRRAAAPAARKQAAKAREPLRIQPHYPVGLYRIEKVPGITSRDLRRLRDRGINLTDALIYADLDRLALETGIARKRLDDWRAMSELMALKGIGATWAETLVKAEVRGIHDLARYTAEDLGKTLIEHYERQRMGRVRLDALRKTVPGRAASLVRSAREAVQAL